MRRRHPGRGCEDHEVDVAPRAKKNPFPGRAQRQVSLRLGLIIAQSQVSSLDFLRPVLRRRELEEMTV